jgi:hypothetical protein
VVRAEDLGDVELDYQDDLWRWMRGKYEFTARQAIEEALAIPWGNVQRPLLLTVVRTLRFLGCRQTNIKDSLGRSQRVWRRMFVAGDPERPLGHQAVADLRAGLERRDSGC